MVQEERLRQERIKEEEARRKEAELKKKKEQEARSEQLRREEEERRRVSSCCRFVLFCDGFVCVSEGRFHDRQLILQLVNYRLNLTAEFRFTRTYV